jgi:hypothetical protein
MSGRAGLTRRIGLTRRVGSIIDTPTLYIGMTSSLGSLYQSEKILIDLEDIQVMIQLDS